MNNDYEIGGAGGIGKGIVDCGICLDPVSDDGKRSWAKLQCNHRFHLDCIGSAFNAKGVMQCPNCRKVEKGDWLFPNKKNHDQWQPDLLDLSVGDSSSLPTSSRFPTASHNGVYLDGILCLEGHESNHIHRRGGDEQQQRATPSSVHYSARSRSGRSFTTPAAAAATRWTRNHVQAPYHHQQSSNPASTTRDSFGSSGSRYNNTRIRNLPPIPYASNNAATNHLQSNSSFGRDFYRGQVVIDI